MRLPRSFRSSIPAAIKRPIRQALDAFDRTRRLLALASAVKDLQRQAQKSDVLPPALLRDLCNAWGNRAFSGDATFLSEMANRVAANYGPFLECGSGISTLIAGVIASRQGKRIWSLEQDGDWCRYVNRMLTMFDITNVTLLHTPLKRHGDFAWFDLDGTTMPDEFTVIFCDGPAILPGAWPEPVYSEWRVGLLPVLQERGIGFREIILDDADDPRCAHTCRVWSDLGVTTTIVSTPTGPFVVGRPRLVAAQQKPPATGPHRAPSSTAAVPAARASGNRVASFATQL